MKSVTKFAALAFGIGLMAASGCSGGGAIGQDCERASDCADELQCFAGTCSPACARDEACGDGHVCESGQCEAVVSNIGDACRRERDCGPGQTCLVAESDPDGDGRLTARCATQLAGAALGTACQADTECRSGSCNIHRCTEVCQQVSDCEGAQTCTDIPRLASDGPALFSGCFQEGGVHTISLPLAASQGLASLMVPGNARSVAITARSTDRSLVAGVYLLTTPTGATWYRTPLTLEEFLANPIRYAPSVRESTMIAPNRPELELVAGSYPIRIGTSFANGEPAQDVPSVRVTYKLSDSSILDINVFILNLAGHPCAARIGDPDFDAETAKDSNGIALFTERLRTILAAADVEIGEVRIRDVRGHPELDALDAGRLSQLLSLGEGEPGLNLFLVRSLEPGGLQVIGGGSPAAPRLPGSPTAGVALSMDTLCYRDWPTAARLVAHAFGRQMGLFRNREPDSATQDPIVDSSPDADNLMFFAEFGGTEISPGQAVVLRRFPGLR